MIPMKAIQSYTTTDLKRSSNQVYNQVLVDGGVIIEHRDRPDMVLITLQEFEKSAKDKA